jgi:hypothetical protein
MRSSSSPRSAGTRGKIGADVRALKKTVRPLRRQTLDPGKFERVGVAARDACPCGVPRTLSRRLITTYAIVGAGEQHLPAQHAGEHQIRESESPSE